MKFLTTILSVYFLVLSSMVCADNEHATLSEKGNAVVKQSPQHSNTDKSDCCGALCSCSCCAVTFTILDNSYLFVVIPQEIITDMFSYIDNTPQEITLSLLQPPQI